MNERNNIKFQEFLQTQKEAIAKEIKRSNPAKGKRKRQIQITGPPLQPPEFPCPPKHARTSESGSQGKTTFPLTLLR